MRKSSLTDRTIRAIKVNPDRRQEIPDAGMTGLYIVVQPTGARSWAFRYRSPIDARPKKFTIGRYPAIGLADARQSAAAAARLVAKGRDPASEKRTAKAIASETTNTVDALLEEFLKHHVRPKLRPSTIKEMERFAASEILPVWAGRKIYEISKADVRQLLAQFTQRGKGAMANRALAVLRKFFNWCVDEDALSASPADGLKMPSVVHSRDRVLSDEEVRWLWTAAEGLGTVGPLFQLLLLTGQRRGEVSGARWSEFDRSFDSWVIPAERAKNGLLHAVPLAPRSKEIIKSLPVINSSRFVFTTTGVSPVSGFTRFKKAIDKRMLVNAQRDMGDEFELPAWRIHDLRRTAASGMARLGQPVHVVEALLNHKSGKISGVAAVYNRHDYADEKRQAACAWANYVEDLVSGVSDNVVRLHR